MQLRHCGWNGVKEAATEREGKRKKKMTGKEGMCERNEMLSF